MSTYPSVMFARNDPDNGNPTDRVRGVDIYDRRAKELILSLEGDSTFEFDARLFRVCVGGAWFHVKSDLGRWVGNWCWDACDMHPATLAAMLNHLKREGWSPDMGVQSLWDAWERGELTERDIEEALAPVVAR